MLVKVLLIFTVCFSSGVISHRRFSKDDYENLVNLLYEKYKVYKRDHITKEDSQNDYSSNYRTKARDERAHHTNNLGNEKRSSILSLHSVTPIHDDESTDDAAKRHFRDIHDGVSKFDIGRSVHDGLPKMDLIMPIHDDEEDAAQKHIVPIHDDMDLTANHFLGGFKNMDTSQNTDTNSNLFGKNDNEVDTYDNYFGTDGTYHIKNMENDKEESVLEVEGGQDESNSVLQHMKPGMEVHSIKMPHVAPQKGQQNAAVGKHKAAPVSNLDKMVVKKKDDNKLKKAPQSLLKKTNNECEKNYKMTHVQVKGVILNLSFKDKKCIGNKSKDVPHNEVLKLNMKSNSSKSPLSKVHEPHNLVLNEIPVHNGIKENSGSTSNFFKGRVMAEKNTHSADYNSTVALFRKEKQNQITNKNTGKSESNNVIQGKKEKQNFSNKANSVHHTLQQPVPLVHKNSHKQRDENPDVFHVKEPRPVPSPKQSSGVIITDMYPEASNPIDELETQIKSIRRRFTESAVTRDKVNRNLQELEHLGIKSSLAAVLSGEEVCIPDDLPTMNKEEFIDSLKKKEGCATLLSFFNKTAVDLNENDGFGDMILNINNNKKNFSLVVDDKGQSAEDIVYDMFSDSDRSGNKFVLDLEKEFDTIKGMNDSSGEDIDENKAVLMNIDQIKNITRSSPKNTILSYHDKRISSDKNYEKYENNAENYLQDLFRNTDNFETKEIDTAINGFVKPGALSRKHKKNEVSFKTPKKDRTHISGTVFDFDKDTRIKRFKIFKRFFPHPMHRHIQREHFLKRMKKSIC